MVVEQGVIKIKGGGHHPEKGSGPGCYLKGIWSVPSRGGEKEDPEDEGGGLAGGVDDQ